MFNSENLQISDVVTGKEGTYVWAKYPGWQHEFDFFIRPDGKVKGRSARGIWCELSKDFAAFLRRRVDAFRK